MAALVRPIAPTDAEGFRAALDEVARERRFLASVEAPPLDQVRAFIESNLTAGNPQFVALADDRVIGWCDIVRSTQAVRRHAGSLGMGVRQGHRGQRIGRALIAATLDGARRSGFLRVELHVRADNAAAIALYESCGFRTEGRLVRDVFVDGRFHDGLTMALLLG